MLIIRSGYGLLIDTVSKLLGERGDVEIAAEVERETHAVDEVRLVSGLVLQDFGPDQLSGTVHVTVDDQMTIAEFDNVVRKVQDRVYTKCGVVLLGVTPYPDTSDDDSVRKIRGTIGRVVWSHEHVLELRGLYVDPEEHSIRFDAIVEFGSGDRPELRQRITKACEAACPGWSIDARVIPDFGD